MEFQKDNQKDNNFTNYNNGGALKPSLLLNTDNYLSFLFKKTEKLVTALYMITNFFSSEEPLKWNIRKIGLALLTRNLSLTRSSIIDKRSVLRQIMSLMIEIEAMLEIAYRSGYVSEMNFTILKKELDALIENLNTGNLHKAENIYPLDKTFFEVENTQTQTVQNLIKENSPQILKPEIDKNAFISRIITKPIERSAINPIIKKYPVIEKENKIKIETKIQTQTTIEKNENNTEKNDRQNLIISVFNKHKGQELSIKDITSFVKDCSEKTIQRVLSILVEKNILQKVGDRRWSKYFLVV